MNCPYCGEHLPERDEPTTKNWRCYTCKVLWVDMGRERHTWQRDEGFMEWKQVPEGTLLVREE